MVPLWLIHIIILIGLVLGSITDFKKREVPDVLNYSLMIIGLAIALLSSLFSGDWFGLLWSVCGLVAGYLIGALMFYTGQWGGGDAKMLMGMGALLGLSVNQLISGQMPLFLTTVITIFFAGAIYGLLFGVYLVAKHWKKFKVEFQKITRTPLMIKVRIGILIVVVTLGIIALVSSQQFYQLFLGLLAVMIFFGFYMIIVGKVIEKACMIKDVKVKDLTEGEWIVKDVVVKGKRICGPKDLGISQENIEKLKKLKVKTVTIKEGIPFIPGFLLGYIIIIAYGNWIPRLVGLFF